MRRFVCLILATIALVSCSDRLIYKDKDAPIEDRVSDLLKRMTIKEKTGQLLYPLGWFMYEKTDDKTVELSALFKQRMNDMPIGGAWRYCEPTLGRKKLSKADLTLVKVPK